MSVPLPTYPEPADAQPSYLDWGGTLRPIFGGALQKLRRMGDRFALTVQMPPLDNAELGMRWVSRLIRARREGGALLPWPQPGFDTGIPGAPVVLGAGQAGTQLILSGFRPGYQIREGQFFSIVHGGRRYLHEAEADWTIPASGTVDLPLGPMLRVSPANGAVCEFAKPMIHGLLDGDGQSWTIDQAMNVGLSFTITEAR